MKLSEFQPNNLSLLDCRQWWKINRQLSNASWLLEGLAEKEAKPHLWKIYCTGLIPDEHL